MKSRIERTLFWFSNGHDQLLSLNERYFALANLLNRLLIEKHEGKKIKYINIYFRTEETYKLHPQATKYHLHFHGEQFSYDDVFDLFAFKQMGENEQDRFIWKRANEILQEASKTIKNNSLLEASEYAYKRGLEIGLNADYRMVEADVIIYEQSMKASVWVNFKKDGMYSKLTLENKGEVVFEKDIDKTQNGVEFFLEMYKSISAEENTIIIKGRKDVDYLPLHIPIEKRLLT